MANPLKLRSAAIAWTSLACVSPAIAQIELPAPLSGVYRVDPKGQGQRVFRDLTTAVRYLSLAGLKGSVTFEVVPGTYDGVLRFFSIPGQKDEDTITLKATGPGVVLTAQTKTVQILDDAHHIVIDGFEFDASGNQPVIFAQGKPRDLVVRNCTFRNTAGSSKMVEIQGANEVRRVELHHNLFELTSRHSYGIYTQRSFEIHVHHNEFRCLNSGEPVSFWNANQSASSVHHNLFRGQIRRNCLRLNVSAHDVRVFENLFVLELTNNRTAAIGSRGLAQRAYNRIHHNLFVIKGAGMAIENRGTIAIDHNTFAIEGGSLGRIENIVCEDADSWREALENHAMDEQQGEGVAIAGKKLFSEHQDLLDLFMPVANEEEAENEEEGQEGQAKGEGRPAGKSDPKAERRKQIRMLVKKLRVDDVAVQRLAMYKLASFGRDAAIAVPSIGKLCGHPHDPVRADAARALGAIGVGAEILAPELIRMLKDDNRFVLLPAMRTLAKLAHLAQPAVARLKELEKDGDSDVQAQATRTLTAILGKQPKRSEKGGTKDSSR